MIIGMCDDDDLEDQIRENAAGPKAATGDMGSVTEHSLQDQIAADKYLAAKKAKNSGALGIRVLKISPGSAVGDR